MKRESDQNPNLTRSEIVVKNLSKFVHKFFAVNETDSLMLVNKFIQEMDSVGIKLRPRLKPWERKRIAEIEQAIESQKRYEFIEKKLASGTGKD